MVATTQELANFHHYAEQRIAKGDAVSLPALMQQWLADKEAEEIDVAIRAGIADVDAGRTRPIDEFLAEVHDQLDDS